MPNDPENYSLTEQAIVMCAKANPELNDNQIAKKISKIRGLAGISSVRNVVVKNPSVRRDIDYYRHKHKLGIAKNDVPRARKVLNKTMKAALNKEIPLKDAIPAASLTLKHGLGEEMVHTQAPATINIRSIQVLNQQTISEKDG